MPLVLEDSGLGHVLGRRLSGRQGRYFASPASEEVELLLCGLPAVAV
jgi:hypothetical protein